MALSESRKRSISRWDAENTKVIGIKLMLKRDADIIDYWAKLPEKADAFREMVSDYMEKHPINDES